MKRHVLSILHISAFIVHLSTAFVMFGLILKKPGNQWPIINRQWLNDSYRYDYYLSILVPIFPFLSSINHIVSLVDSDGYNNILKNKVNYLRWAEYSVSAGIMLWIIATLSGILEIRSLVTLAMLNATLQYIGYLIERNVAANTDKKETLKLLWAAWAIHLSIWVQIFISFFTVTQDSNAPIPDTVYTIIISLFILFSSFGILETLWVFQIIKSFDILEMGYIILSLSAKLFLSFFVYFGVLNADR